MDKSLINLAASIVMMLCTAMNVWYATNSIPYTAAAFTFTTFLLNLTVALMVNRNK